MALASHLSGPASQADPGRAPWSGAALSCLSTRGSTWPPAARGHQMQGHPVGRRFTTIVLTVALTALGASCSSGDGDDDADDAGAEAAGGDSTAAEVELPEGY